jgi:hypothetical protein
MNLPVKMIASVLACCLFVIGSQATTVITNNFGLSPADTSLEGGDLVISNCTVTMDGAHSFNSLILGTGGTLTCTANPSGSATLSGTATNEQLVLSGTNPSTLFYSYVSGSVTLTDSNQDLFTNGADFVQTTLGNQTQIARTTNSTIPDGATVLATYTWSVGFNTGLNISLTNGLNVAAGGSINLNGGGYGGNNGSGHGNTSLVPPADGSGGGHGGSGGMSISNAPGGSGYGSLYQPVTLGGAGGISYAGNGGSGGGRIQIIAGGGVNIDGMISANGFTGTNSRSGGGAGGSIWIVASNTFSGAGNVAANGGAGEPTRGGSGGGGRISIQCGTNIYSGSIAAYGGSGGKSGGGAGTVFIQTNGQTGQLTLDNGGHTGTNSVVNLSTLADVLVQNSAWLTPSSSTFQPRNLVIGTNGILAMSSPTALALNVAGNFTIQSGGALLADTNGNAPNSGAFNSAGGMYSGSSSTYCGGGGHGGYGGASSQAAVGVAYDSATAPTGFGGGGGGMYAPTLGGAGGGALQISVNGTLQVDGKISANGGNGTGTGGGGGAGGSIYIQNCNLLAGAGSIGANGGNGVPLLGGGGGGGCIAAYFNTNIFTGTFSASGGSGTNYGGAGTIYFKTNSAANGQLVMDNGGKPGAFTTLPQSSSIDLTLRNGAYCFLPFSTSFGNLTVGSNSTLCLSNTSVSQTTLTAASINVQPGGLITCDQAGYNPGSGNGPGNSGSAGAPYYPCSGAGHGGYGGITTNYTGNGYGNGGFAYDSQSGPSQAGSGGGSFSPYSTGGRGGGALKLSVQGNVQIDGTISANAGNGTGIGGGGGSGGSIYIGSATLAGAGSLSANGGNGASSQAGGGAGGIIYVSFNSSSFSGNVTAYGGAGFGNGGAGTVYFQTNSGQSLFIVDNGGRHGSTNTPVNNYGNNWFIRNGATVQPTSPNFTLNSLIIGTNSTLSPYFGGTLNLTVNGNVTIQPGGAILTDNGGGSPNNGAGHGSGYAVSPYYPGGGGGHGGYGGMGATNLGFGGVTYDSTASPSLSGSGGGSYNTSSSPGGSGGGYVRLNVNGNLQLDGGISANGGNGAVGGGGGSGGTIYVSVNGNYAFRGAGSISANGGNGGPYGGGGGGGRIAVYYTSNFVEHSTFNGPVTAYGGIGVNNGGAGTIYTQNNSQQPPQLILDNNNNAGTNTVFDNVYCAAVIQNKAVGFIPQSGWSVSSITIRTNSALVGVPLTQSTVSVTANNITNDAGGMLSLDAGGYGSSSGAGYAQFGAVIRGGGGHGGYGGGNNSGYGGAYDSITSPGTPGSGGAGASYLNGGAGGGALRLNVIGTFVLNGRLSANGGNGDPGGGGGSGGTLYVGVNRLMGNGLISANGGSGTDNPTGGGAGGRIAVVANNSTFTGQMSATGGGGTYPGGAGTIYKNFAGYQTLTIDNGGIAGTNTPLTSAFSLPSTTFDLNIANQAIVAAASPLPLLNNLNLNAGSTLTGTAGGVFISVRTNANLLGNIILDNRGYTQGNGPGFGTNLNQNGAGGGYGGAGGNSASGASGGGTNGSPTQPADFGSGGGYGANTIVGGSEGGGAIRLSIGGNLNLGGNVSANGDYGWQDNSGGGAGGSIWIAANSITGTGNLSVAGGNGDLWNGGGGGGGRIAIYSPTNLFTGTTNAGGGIGFASGQSGTILFSGSLLNFSVASMSPSNTVNSTVSYVDFTFSDAVDPASVSDSAFTLTTPTGTVDPSNFTAAATSTTSVRLSFPLQNALGTYTLTATAPLANLLEQPLQNFSGTFSISIPTVSGNVSDTNGAPVASVSLQPDGGLPATLTDSNGNYSIPVPPGWTGGITPSLGQLFFVPGTLGLTNVIASLTNQNFIAYQSLSPALASGFDGTNVTLSWQSISNVSYSVLDSTDLMNWIPYSGAGSLISGTNGLMQFIDPVNFNSPQLFYRLSITH